MPKLLPVSSGQIHDNHVAQLPILKLIFAPSGSATPAATARTGCLLPVLFVRVVMDSPVDLVPPESPTTARLRSIAVTQGQPCFDFHQGAKANAAGHDEVARCASSKILQQNQDVSDWIFREQPCRS